MDTKDIIKDALEQFDKIIESYLPDIDLLATHKEGLEATKLVGESLIEVPDYAVRHKYLETAYRIKNRFPAEKKELDVKLHDFDVFDMPAIKPPDEVTSD